MRNPFEEELARRNLLEFTQFTMPKFQAAWFHESYYTVLQKFIRGEIKNLMVFVPPQHGKSEGSTRRLPAYMLGINPDLKIGIVSYSAPKARKFNKEIQRIITSTEYRYIFPSTTLSRTQAAKKTEGTYLRNSEECEIVGYVGGFKTVGVQGPLTGDPVDILILDDIYKDQKAAWSPTVRESIQDWYDTVADSRLHNDSRVLIVFTRWHQDDLAGHLLRQEGRADQGGKWHVISYPAIKEGKPTDYDPRKDGEPLWPEKHSLAKLQATQKRNKVVFQNLYQQNPKPVEGLLYKELRTYQYLPEGFPLRRAVIDTADTGDDYLCSIVYMPTPSGYYLLDVLFTDDGMEITEPKTAVQLTKWQVNKCRVESNNGGRGFARSVEKICREVHHNAETAFKWYHQSNNKEVRIFTYAAAVQNMVFFPADWEKRWPTFYEHVTGYLAKGGNKHDDGPDALTMIIEAENRGPEIMEEPPSGPNPTSEIDFIKNEYYS